MGVRMWGTRYSPFLPPHLLVPPMPKELFSAHIQRWTVPSRELFDQSSSFALSPRNALPVNPRNHFPSPEVST